MVPRYANRVPILRWLRQPIRMVRSLRVIFCQAAVEETDKLSLAAFHLTREAQQFYMFEQKEPGVSWETFKSF